MQDQIYENVITVGDPDRVEAVAKHLDSTHYKVQKREFSSIGGQIGDKKITIISTGIGTDNVDIVFNELSFLLNFNLQTREKKANSKNIDIFRIGTSGSVSEDVALGSFVYSKNVISFDDLFKFYTQKFDTITFDNREYEVIPCSRSLEQRLESFQPSLTLTAKGFYAPQFRRSALEPKYSLNDLASISYKNQRVGNIEMETAGIYGLSQLLGFNAISLNAILADRINGTFSPNPEAVIEKLIVKTLDIIC
ncbi:MAG: phosphorylase [Bacteroidia bacterium]|nr:phosphorylase [Bacteroidia bacterium]